jgi:hypothetical protein
MATAQELVNQYLQTYTSGLGNSNSELPLAMNTANQWWDSEAMQKQRQYSEQLRSGARSHEKSLLGMETGSAERRANIQAGAQRYGAKQSADASRFGAAQSAAASRFGASKSAEASMFGSAQAADASRFGATKSAEASMFGATQQLKAAEVGAATDRYRADKDFDLGKIQSETSLKQTRLQTDTDKYTAGLGLQGQLAGFASQERIAAGAQQGENFRSVLGQAAETQRTGMQLATQERGQGFELLRGLASAPNRFAQLNPGNMRYWG